MPGRGYERELAVKKVLEAEGKVVIRSAGSKVLDLCALEVSGGLVGVQLIEVKSTTAGPFCDFPPQERAALLDLARRCGAVAWLAWWPPRGELRWIPSERWPAPRSTSGDLQEGSG